MIERVMAEAHIPGLALGIQRGGVQLIEMYAGCANVEHDVSVQAETMFEIASVTKLFTAQAVLWLMQDGRIGLDDPLARYLPTLPEAWHAVTVRHVLAHQSGIPSYTGVQRYWTITREAKSQEQILDLVREQPLAFSPGERHAYDNTGFYLLGMLIEAVSGKSYGEFLEGHIFKPLGMEHTRVNDYDAVIPNRAQGYIYRDGVLHNKAFYDTSNTYSAGNLLSTVRDLLRWSGSLFNDSILNASTRRLWWTPHPSRVGNERDHHFTAALGWFIVELDGRQFFGHNGGIAGFASSFFYLPSDDITAVLLCNAGHINEPHRIALQAIHDLK